ncbi:hypothetical protein SAMN05661091_2718 [Paenibacillus uliginis N3/975]|uniref:Pilus assembly protein PilO n=2 Tax=Paenibacillus TaxID=44249 RepID=A0A1X7HE89_9BACL|nr:hypothetical protein SAMN05661091_2718 [Paenibacillus uliginis N3/975]
MNAKHMKVLVLAALSLIVLSGLLIFYMNKVSPTQKEVRTIEKQITQDIKLLETLQKQIEEQQNVKVDTVALQQKVPVQALVDQLLLDIRALEKSSLNTVQNIGVSYSKTTMTELFQASGVSLEAVNSSPKENSTNESIASNSKETEEGVATMETEAQASPSPNNASVQPEIYKVVLGMTVKTPTFADLEKFILGLENLKRVIKVDTLNLTEEVDTYSLSISTFYVPQMEGVVEELLPASYPLPSGKINPFNVNKPIINTPGS